VVAGPSPLADGALQGFAPVAPPPGAVPAPASARVPAAAPAPARAYPPPSPPRASR